jgi:ubiquinone biosynthesis protein UbiJ
VSANERRQGTPPVRAITRKRATALTDEERQLLLAELAEIMAELDELQSRTAEIAARVSGPESAHLARPA